MVTWSSCSGWLTGSALRISESIRLKMAVLAPDSQRQREDRHGGESGTGAQSANRITNVLHNGVEHFAIMTPSELRLAPPRISNAARNSRPFESSSRPKCIWLPARIGPVKVLVTSV